MQEIKKFLKKENSLSYLIILLLNVSFGDHINLAGSGIIVINNTKPLILESFITLKVIYNIIRKTNFSHNMKAESIQEEMA